MEYGSFDFQARDFRDIIENRPLDVSRPDVLIPVFGPFNSKYHFIDSKMAESLSEKITTGDDVVYEFLDTAMEFRERFMRFLTNIVEELQEFGFNAFRADEVPPFKSEDDISEEWRDTNYSTNELVVPNFDFIQQSRLCADIGDQIAFVFRYIGNPIGTVFELADIFANDEQMPSQTLLFYEEQLEWEESLSSEYPEYSEEWYRSEKDIPHYLSAMVSEVGTLYDEVRWIPFINPNPEQVALQISSMVENEIQ
ncbi:hypothetical protein [Haloarcula argentinensis]|uniref:Uncharacterized protein n=1 Tax=Haloarcula argentinensis TaxID=43776 RepID=A0A830FEX8_HALAR|nr:hypothetical protein [Haloarcula argentinensis]GGM40099.1 hypothetical protein GCM10009006_21500 [Haloarcula argentinensis]